MSCFVLNFQMCHVFLRHSVHNCIQYRIEGPVINVHDDVFYTLWITYIFMKELSNVFDQEHAMQKIKCNAHIKVCVKYVLVSEFSFNGHCLSWQMFWKLIASVYHI